MTYAEALAFWYGRIDYERRQPRPGDLKLDRMRTLLSRLGDPHKHLRCVHVAGTKGKGSTCAMLASVLRAAGFHTGLFTSPIFPMSRSESKSMAERFRMTRSRLTCPKSQQSSVAWTQQMIRHNRQRFSKSSPLSDSCNFAARMSTLLSWRSGFGGRFDSTNVCEPLVSIITNVSFDHTAILGPTLAEIAFQKRALSSQAYQS